MSQFRIDSYAAQGQAPVSQVEVEFDQFFKADAFACAQENQGFRVVYLREEVGQGFQPMGEDLLRDYLLDA